LLVVTLCACLNFPYYRFLIASFVRVTKTSCHLLLQLLNFVSAHWG
jgi:preprotein translocase subunit SecB